MKNILMGMGDEMDPSKRYFIKKWNDFLHDFVYKEVKENTTRDDILVPEDFMMIKLAETDNIVVLNESELPPQGYEIKDGFARRTW
jgi:hypothetical protein